MAQSTWAFIMTRHELDTEALLKHTVYGPSLANAEVSTIPSAPTVTLTGPAFAPPPQAANSTAARMRKDSTRRVLLVRLDIFIVLLRDSPKLQEWVCRFLGRASAFLLLPPPSSPSPRGL